jgi:hypothetical protein
VPKKETYLVRDGGGKMRSVTAFSHKGAIRQYLVLYPSERGETLEVKARGDGPDTWMAFKLS